jgi:hypothetical protein
VCGRAEQQKHRLRLPGHCQGGVSKAAQSPPSNTGPFGSVLHCSTTRPKPVILHCNIFSGLPDALSDL